VALVSLPNEGAVDELETAYWYPVDPLMAVQLILAPLGVILVTPGGAGAGHNVVNCVEDQAEKFPLPQLFLTYTL
jgi:hypothetical protein